MTGLDLEGIYACFPVPVQNLLTSLEGLRLKQRRFNAEFRDIFRRTMKRDFLAGPPLRDYQGERLSRHLAVASTAPFWQERFSRYRVNAAASDPFAELARLPILTKEEVQREGDRLIPREYQGKELLVTHTSGTTGGGLIFPETPAAEKERWAVWWRYRFAHGIRFQHWCGYFGGRSVVPLSQESPPFWRFNLPNHQLMLSGYHLSGKTAGDYLRTLQTHRISWLHGYPSLLAVFAGYAREHSGHATLPLRIITIGAESLLPAQKTAIQNAFRVPVREHYGLAESVSNISECPEGSLHVDEDFALTEFVPLEGSRMARIIGTNWTNPAYPLLRYDTGDLAEPREGLCVCGRKSRLVHEIDGRREDVVVLRNGAVIGRLDHIFKDLVHIREAQIVQSIPGEILCRIVKGPGYDSHPEENRLIDETKKRLGEETKIEIEYVDRLPRSKTGKLRFVVSSLKNPWNL